MSRSTVSITASPAASARRISAVVAGDKPSITTDLSTPSDSLRRTTSVDSRRREPILQRPSMDPKRTVSPRRSRRLSAKPRWLTLLSVFTKNLALLLVLLGLVQLIRKLTLMRPRGGDISAASISDFEGRVAEVEALMKTTAAMIQVQVDVADRKIEREVVSLKRDARKQIEDQSVALEGRFQNLEARTEGLESKLDKLSASGLMSKEEFERVYEELVKNVKGSESGETESDVSLDDLRAYARDVISKEIEKHAADGLGRVDYALGTGGADVVEHSEPFLAGRGGSWFSMNNRNGVHGNAVKVLQPSFGEPGQCFALKGSSGFVQIRLRTAIIPESVTLEHVAKSVAYDRSSAAKESRVSGWLQGDDIEPDENRKMFLLTEFSYDLEKSNAQTFNVLESARSAVVDMIRFDFISNHGSPSHTCLYRLRVHGHEPDPIAMMTMRS